MSAGALDLRCEHAVTHWVERHEAEIFQFGADAVQPHAVSDWSVDFQRLARHLATLVRFERSKRSHVVQAIRELDQDHADVARHREHHLAKVLSLRFRATLEGQVGQLAHAIDELRDLLAELFFDVILRSLGVLDDVVQDRGDDGLRIEVHLRENARDLQGVVDVGFTGGTVLSLVGLRAKQVGPVYLLDLIRLQVALGEAAEIADQKHRINPLPRGSGVHPSVS